MVQSPGNQQPWALVYMGGVLVVDCPGAAAVSINHFKYLHQLHVTVEACIFFFSVNFQSTIRTK